MNKNLKKVLVVVGIIFGMWIGLKTIATIEMNKYVDEKQATHHCLIFEENIENYGIFGKKIHYVEFADGDMIFVEHRIGK